MKKIIATLCFCVMAIIAICSITKPEAQAETVTSDIRNVPSVNTLSVEDLAQKYLGSGEYTYEYISGFEDIDRYILVEGNNSYMVFDTIVQDFMECSANCNSPYWLLPSNFEKIYFQPTFYFYCDNGIYYDLQSGVVLTQTDIDNYINAERQNRIKYVQMRNNALVSQPLRASGGGGDNTPLIVHSVPFSNYFVNLKSYVGINYKDFGETISICMLFSYLDTFLDDNFIPDHFEEKVNKSFDDYSEIKASAYTQSPGIKISFQDYLIEMGINAGIETTNTKENIRELINLYGESAYWGLGAYYRTENVLNECKNSIDNDCPIIVGISGNGLPSVRTVVAYGYVENNLIINTGNAKDPQTALLLSGYTLDFSVGIFVEMRHRCSDNYEWSCNGGSGTVCLCGNKICFHNSINCVSAGDTNHNYVCNACGKIMSSEEHNFAGISSLRCSECGYRRPHTHNYIYTPSGVGKHRKVCFGCKTNEIETCMAFINPDGTSVCGKCGQTIPDGVIINCIEEQEKIEEVFRALAMPVQPQIILPQ